MRVSSLSLRPALLLSLIAAVLFLSVVLVPSSAYAAAVPVAPAADESLSLLANPQLEPSGIVRNDMDEPLAPPPDCDPVTVTPPTPVPIPDNNAAFTCVPIPVAAPSGIVTTGSTLRVAVNHTWIGDLIFQLRAPDGTFLIVMNRPGVGSGAGDDADLSSGSPITFRDGASTSAEAMGSTSTSPTHVVCGSGSPCEYFPAPDGFTGSLANFAGFSGETATGTWQFCASDRAGQDTGNIASVTLDLACTGVLAVELAAFDATVTDGGVNLTWATVSEMDTLGFNLLRGTTDDPAQATALNPELIPATGGAQGASYEWLDSTVEPGTTYYYWLVDIDTTGVQTTHGPVTATPGVPTAVTLGALGASSASARAPLLVGAGLALAAAGLVLRRRATR